MSFGKAFFLLLLMVILSSIHLSIYTRTINLKYDVEGLKRTLASIRRETRSLESVAATRKDLSRIENIAYSRLKMIRPEKINYIITTPEQTTP